MRETSNIVTPDGGPIQREGPDEHLHDVVEDTELRRDQLSPEEIAQIEREFEASPEIQEYLIQPTNIAKIEELSSWLEQESETLELGSEELQEIVATINDYLNTAKQYCRRYGQVVQRFEHLRRNRYRFDNRDFAEHQQRLDQERRRTHDATLGTFRTFNKYVSVTLHKEYSVDVPREYYFDDDRIFHERQGYGTEWVQTTDYYLQARSLIQSLKEKGPEQDSSPSE